MLLLYPLQYFSLYLKCLENLCKHVLIPSAVQLTCTGSIVKSAQMALNAREN